VGGNIVDPDIIAALGKRYTKASTRAKVEHPFHVVKNLFRHRKARYKRLAKNAAQLFSLFGFANLMLARRWLLNTHTQGVSRKREMRKMSRNLPQFRLQSSRFSVQHRKTLTALLDGLICSALP